MKKVDRLVWIERTFGADCISPYRVCRTWPEIRDAIAWVETFARSSGIRTDFPNGVEQGYGLPFVCPADKQQAGDLWRIHGDRLLYIVSAAVMPVLLNGVGLRLDDEHVLFEINDREPWGTQREMYRRPEHLRRFVVGHGGYVLWNGRPERSFNPEEAACLKLDRVWKTMVAQEVSEATFSVTSDRRLVVW